MKTIPYKNILKTKFICGWLSVMLLLIPLQHAFAINQTPQIKKIHYQPDQIVTLNGTHFIATSVQFSKSEKIEGVYMGDQVAWTYAINPSISYILFIKPTLDRSDTNLTVITNLRVYHFHLISNVNKINEAPLYCLKFEYGTENQNQKLIRNRKNQHYAHQKCSQQSLNTNYSVSGSSALLPKTTYDDGTFTYFEFPYKAVIPVIFKVEGGHEKLINTETQHNLVIAKCVAKKFSLQKNNQKAWVENNNKKAVNDE